MIIAIDGPAGAGKSSVAKAVAAALGFTYIDTGAMYRAITLKALETDLNLQNADELVGLLKQSNIELINENNSLHIYLDGRDVSRDIRQPEVTKSVSLVSSYAGIRDLMVEKQRKIATFRKGVIMDGRDIGTVVFPDADIKVYMVASVEERALRRYKEEQEKGIETDLEKLKADIARRDEFDSNRPVAPLKPAGDAVILETTRLSFDEVVKEVLDIYQLQVSKRNPVRG